MSNKQADEELTLKRKARRRLVGAVAFTLIVVAVLPMLLDSEPNPAISDVSLEIPNAGSVEPFRSQPPQAMQPRRTIIDDTGDETVVIQSAAETPAPVVERAVSEKNSAVLPKPVVHKVAEPAPVVVTKAEPAEPAKPEKTKPKPKPVQFSAQIGAYSNKNAAEQEVGKLKQLGFKAYTEATKNMVRVRVGPFDNRDQAEQAVWDLAAKGINSVVMSVK